LLVNDASGLRACRPVRSAAGRRFLTVSPLEGAGTSIGETEMSIDRVACSGARDRRALPGNAEYALHFESNRSL
jgi:hypothetical protein